MSFRPEDKEIKHRYDKMSSGQKQKWRRLYRLYRMNDKLADIELKKYKKDHKSETHAKYMKHLNAGHAIIVKMVRILGIQW